MSFFPRRVLAICGAALLGLAFASPASAQSSRNQGCVLDRCQDRPDAAPARNDANPARNQRPPDESPRRETRDQATSVAPGRFDFYVLSLSWSPSFCLSNDRPSAQCDRGAELGFVLHGLWPQFERGFPSDCDARAPSSVAMQAARGVWPDDGLARYEWRKHGTCSGKAPADYFADARRAKESIEIPDALKAPKRQTSLSANDIQRAFIAENPRLRPGMMAVMCQRGQLQEVRFCLSKDLRDFRACPDVVRSACRTQQVSIPPVR